MENNMLKVRFLSPINTETNYIAISEQEYKYLICASMQLEAIDPYNNEDYRPFYKRYIEDELIPMYSDLDSNTFSSWINAMKTDPEESDSDVYQRLSLADFVDYEVDIADNY